MEDLGFNRNELIESLHEKKEKTAESEFYFAFVEALRRAGFKRLIINLEDETRISTEK